jgi:hypothetical protein
MRGLGSTPALKVARCQASMLRDSRQHARPNFLIIVKAEDEIWPTRSGQGAVGAGGALEGPPNSEECRKDSAGLGGAPTAHAA